MPVGELLERRRDDVARLLTRERIDLRFGIVRLAQVLAHPERGVRLQEFVVNRLRKDRAGRRNAETSEPPGRRRDAPCVF